LSEHIKIKTQGDCARDCLLKILVKTASRSDTIENTINSLNDVPASNTVRDHLNKLDNFEELEKNLNSALKSKLMPSINKTQLSVAIDLNLIPYYGKPSSEELPYIDRSEAKLGTYFFYAHVILCILNQDQRFTIAIRAVRRQETIVATLTYLLAELASHNLKIKKLYLDRGFFTVPVIRKASSSRHSFCYASY
jgi:hypothetical protein